MPQTTIGQRIKFLIDTEGLSVRRFAQMLDVAETNIRNYLDKGTKPSSDALEKMVRSFPRTNLVWLVTGDGDPFLTDTPESSTKQTGNFNQAGTSNKQTIKGNKGNVIGTNQGTTTTNNYNLADCEKERDTIQAQLEKAQREIELLNGQLRMQETIIQGKDEMLDLLRGGFNRPN